MRRLFRFFQTAIVLLGVVLFILALIYVIQANKYIEAHEKFDLKALIQQRKEAIRNSPAFQQEMDKEAEKRATWAITERATERLHTFYDGSTGI